MILSRRILKDEYPSQEKQKGSPKYLKSSSHMGTTEVNLDRELQDCGRRPKNQSSRN